MSAEPDMTDIKRRLEELRRWTDMTEYRTDLDPLRDLLDQWSIKHFTAEELTSHHSPSWDGPRHICPPPDKITHIRRTVEMADRIRDLWGRPIDCLSGYRCPEYNRLICGAAHSAHMAFRAMDIRPLSGDMTAFKCIVDGAMQSAAMFSATGYGRDYDAGFVHIDFGHDDPDDPHDRTRRWEGAPRYHKDRS